ncbi:phage tail tape measure protein [Halobacillus sp. BBL2006]|uniref:phage tail tape measure protein n=1 Tax=Halobacillus sp. BBL2006 TaxID=1543706 RepID=UPI000692123E|nr:phage tail tape measure protein [Halobacillus sp. BBL2006]
MAERIEGLSIGLDLESAGLSRSLTSLKRELKTVDSEMKKNMSSFDRSDKSVQKYETRIQGLNKKLNVQKQTVDAAERKMNEMTEQYGENSAKAQRATKEYNDQVAALRNLDRYTKNATDELEQMRKEQEKANSAFGKASQGLSTFSDRTDKISKNLGTAGKTMTLGMTVPLAGLGAAAIKTGMEFEAAMSEVKAISGASSEDMVKLEKKAREMGATTKYSASEAANAMKFMGLAGWDAQQSIDGLDGVMNLAAASGEDLGAVSDILTDGLSAFGMKAKDAGRFADVLAAASSNANTTVAGLGKAFEYVAPVAGSLGFTIEDTAHAIGIMSNAGIKGEKAGTALRSMMTNLAKPTGAMEAKMKELGISLTDSEGNMLTFEEVMGDLRTSFADLSEKQKASAAATLFGKEAMSGALSIINASESDYKDLAASIGASEGAAKDMADTMNDNAKGKLKEMQSALQELGIIAAEHLLPPLTSVIEGATELAQKFGKLPEGTQKTIIAVGALATVLGPLSLAFSGVFRGISLMTGGLGKIVGKLGAAKVSSSIAGKALGSFGGAASKSGTKALTTAGSFGKAAGSLTKVGKVAGIARLGLAGLGGPMGLLATIAIPELIKGGVKLVKHLREDSIPAVEGFGSEVSKSTEKAVLSYKDLNDKATTELNELFWSGQTITQEGSAELVSTFEKMGSQISSSLDKEFNESYKTLSSFLVNSKNLSKQEQENILQNLKEGNTKQKAELQAKEDRILEIMNTAKKEKRALKESEKAEIGRLQEEMKYTAIETMSQSEKEQKAILEKLKNEASTITARQAADTVKNSLKAKDGSVKEAKEKYKKVKEAAERERDETGSISKEEASAIIKEAERQRDESIDKAENMHENVVKQAKKQAEGQVDQIDWASGEILSKWDKLVRGVRRRVNAVLLGVNWILDKIGLPNIPLWPAPEYAKGTDRSGHPGGPAIVGEKGRELAHIPGVGTTMVGTRGPEMINLPKGSAVLPNKETERTLKSYGFPGYAGGIGDFFEAVFSAPKKLIESAWNKFAPSPPDVGGSLEDIMTGSYKHLKSKASSYLLDKLKGMFGSGGFSKGGFGPPFRRTSRAGWRVHPIFGTRRFHAGDDWGAPAGTPIPSKSSGIVTFSGYNSARGNYVKVKSGAYDFIYQHNSRNYVSKGDMVRQGQTIGTVGSTGHSTGPHLHFEVKKNGAFVPPSALGFKTGGRVGSHGFYELAEEGYPEWVIPTAPSRRSEAQKLLALAGREIEGKNKRPHQFRQPRSTSNNDSYITQVIEKMEMQLSETQSIVTLLTQLLMKDSNIYLSGKKVSDQLEPYITNKQKDNKEVRDLFAT